MLLKRLGQAGTLETRNPEWAEVAASSNPTNVFCIETRDILTSDEDEVMGDAKILPMKKCRLSPQFREARKQSIKLSRLVFQYFSDQKLAGE